MMSKTFCLKTAIAWAGLVLATAPVGAQKPADYSAYPCLSYTLDCGKLATRKPQAESLAGTLNGNAEKGKQITQARNRGNCLACHVMAGGSQPGTRGPDLSHYGSAGKTDAEIYSSIWDMRTLIPDTLMPPFGTNEVLTDQELRDVVAYLQSSK